MKRLTFVFGLFLALMALSLTSCSKKNDNTVTGTITYGPEHKTAILADVQLVDAKTDSTYMDKKTDQNGSFKFYPVNNGRYYIYAHYTTLLGDEYEGESDNFTLLGTTNKVVNLNLNPVSSSDKK